MTCWKTINLAREYGLYRINLVSVLVGLLSFILLYLPFSMALPPETIREDGLIPLLIALAALPTAHKLMHILPLLLLHKRIRLKWEKKFGLFPNFSFLAKSKMSKTTSMMILLAPTLLLTVPGIISGYLFPGYFVYFLVFTAVNIGSSCTDFFYIKQVFKAPRRCLVENARDGYDILIQ